MFPLVSALIAGVDTFFAYNTTEKFGFYDNNLITKNTELQKTN